MIISEHIYNFWLKWKKFYAHKSKEGSCHGELKLAVDMRRAGLQTSHRKININYKLVINKSIANYRKININQ